MEAGLYLNPQTMGPDNDHTVIEAVIGHTRLAEQKGFKAVWLTEHCFTGYNAYSDPLMLGAHLTAVAPSLAIGFAIAVGPLHHPIRFANQCAILDNLCGGRLIVGIGSGAGKDEFAGYGMDIGQKHAELDAFLKIVIGAWEHPGGEPFVYDSPWWKGVLDGRIIPAPIQKPYPMIARATLTPSSARELGRLGRPLLLSITAGVGEGLWDVYLEGLAEGALTDDQRARALEWCSFTQQTYISDGPDPVSEVWEHSKVYLHKNVRANNGYDWASPELWEQKKAHYKNGTMNIGSAQQVLDKLAPWAERGMRHTMVWPYFGDMPPALAAETIQRFAEDVLPHLQRINPPPSPWGTKKLDENWQQVVLQ